MPEVLRCYNNECPGHNEKEDNFCCKPYYRDYPDKCPQCILLSETDKKPDKYYARILILPACICGRRKDKGRAFCFKCSQKLPVERKRLLKNKIGDGFGEGYDSCRRFFEVDIKKQSSFIKN